MKDIWGPVVARILAARTADHLLVAVDGVDGAGKSTFARTLVELLRGKLGDSVVLSVALDDFHHLREHRYRQGPGSPIGYFEDSHDHAAVRERVLDPLRSARGAATEIVLASHDLRTDELVSPAPVPVGSSSVVVVEGIFAHRDELAGCFDVSVFLEVPFAETARRMAERDGSDPDPGHPSMHRYIEGQRVYFARCSPRDRATIVIDNTDPTAPEIVEER